MRLQVELVKSTIGAIPKHKKTVKALGLKKLHSVKVFDDNKYIKGMINQVKHLVEVKEIN